MPETTNTWFITGTDTGCGKTTVTAALAGLAAGHGLSVACFKPIASGCQRRGDRWVNDDALALMDAATLKLDYDRVNPVAFAPPIAPHIAARRNGVAIDVDALAAGIASVDAGLRLVEGVGGWMVPLGSETMLAELPRRLGAAVVLVVGMRLGCINHALLTARAIVDDGFKLAGWVANFAWSDFEAPEANLETLEQRLPAPLLATMRHRDVEPAPEISAILRGLTEQRKPSPRTR